ncbi:hypothetical protein D4100_23225 [Serratia inhibens]|uniref:Uncharacterized protein n=1 Tax=Serratia inhibens TaxID=2338073 RepID=A0AA92X4E7_9GAMM|nr:hypothetical protein D4100_23225 [Serratia inhibens]
MCLTCFGEAHRHCVAHILLSPTFKSNNFSQLTRICTIHAQHGRFRGKKSVLSTGNSSKTANKVNGFKQEMSKEESGKDNDGHKKAQ